MLLEEGLVTRLRDTNGINTLVSGRVYAGMIDERNADTQGALRPCICYQFEEDEPVYHFGGASGIAKAVVLINCWGGHKHTDRTVAKQIRDAVRDSISGLHGLMGVVVNVRHCLLIDNGDIEYVSPGNNKLRAYGVQLEARIMYAESIPSRSGA